MSRQPQHGLRLTRRRLLGAAVERMAGDHLAVGTKFHGRILLYVPVVAGSWLLLKSSSCSSPPIASGRIAGRFAAPCASSVNAVFMGFTWVACSKRWHLAPFDLMTSLIKSRIVSSRDAV